MQTYNESEMMVISEQRGMKTEPCLLWLLILWFILLFACHLMQMLLENPINIFNGPFPPLALVRSGNLGEIFSENSTALSKSCFKNVFMRKHGDAIVQIPSEMY